MTRAIDLEAIGLEEMLVTRQSGVAATSQQQIPCGDDNQKKQATAEAKTVRYGLIGLISGSYR
jgi:hypothetical protein